MDIKLIRRIVELAEQSQITELEIQEGEMRIRVAKGALGQAPALSMLAPAAVAQVPVVSPAAAPADTAAPAPAQDAKLSQITSPMVGTFYQAPTPDAKPYVQVGDRVNDDTVVCIVEAMKVMNEITAGMRGVITEALVENTQPVEYGQPIFRVRLD